MPSHSNRPFTAGSVIKPGRQWLSGIRYWSYCALREGGRSWRDFLFENFQGFSIHNSGEWVITVKWDARG